eukprot:544949_1
MRKLHYDPPVERFQLQFRGLYLMFVNAEWHGLGCSRDSGSSVWVPRPFLSSREVSERPTSVYVSWQSDRSPGFRESPSPTELGDFSILRDVVEQEFSSKIEAYTALSSHSE